MQLIFQHEYYDYTYSFLILTVRLIGLFSWDCVVFVRSGADPAAVCLSAAAGSRRQKCQRCSASGHPCVPDALPPSHQAAVRAAAAAGSVAPALRGWEGELSLSL